MTAVCALSMHSVYRLKVCRVALYRKTKCAQCENVIDYQQITKRTHSVLNCTSSDAVNCVLIDGEILLLLRVKWMEICI